MVGGEAIPKTGGEAVRSGLDQAAQSARDAVCEAKPAQVEQAYPVSESAPDRFMELAPEQTIMEPEGSSRRTTIFDAPTAEGVIEPRLKALNYSKHEGEAFRRLFDENVRTLRDGAAPVKDGGQSVDVEISKAELNEIFRWTAEQYSELKANVRANGMPTEMLPYYVEVGLRQGISPDRLPAAFKEAVSPEGFERLLDTIGGRHSAEAMERAEAAKRSVKGRIKESVVSKAKSFAGTRVGAATIETGMGAGLWFAAEEAAELIGIENPVMRFGFVIGTMHYGHQGINTMVEIGKLKYETGLTVGETLALRKALAAQGVAESGGAVAEKTIASRAKGIARLAATGTVNLMEGIGIGLLLSKGVTEGLMASGVDSSTAGSAGTVAFFAPGALDKLTVMQRGMTRAQFRAALRAEGRLMQACGRMGLRTAGLWVAAAMIADLSAEGAAMFVAGDNYDYAASLEMKAADKFDELMWDQFMAGTEGWSDPVRDAAMAVNFIPQLGMAFGDFLMPGVMRRTKALAYHKIKGNSLDDTLGGDELWKRDVPEASKTRKELPARLRECLVFGFRGEDADIYKPEFYTEVDLGWLGEELEIDDNDAADDYLDAIDDRGRLEDDHDLTPAALEEADVYLTARGIQLDLESLHMTDFFDGDPIRELVDDDGVLEDDKEDAFLEAYLAPAYAAELRKESGGRSSSLDADGVRARILGERRDSLVIRIIAADVNEEAEEYERFSKLARKVGVMDEKGRIDPKAYASAMESLLELQSGVKGGEESKESKEILSKHLERLENESLDDGAESPQLATFNAADRKMQTRGNRKRAKNLFLHAHSEREKIFASKLSDDEKALKADLVYSQLDAILAGIELSDEDRQRAKSEAHTAIIHSQMPPPGK